MTDLSCSKTCLQKVYLYFTLLQSISACFLYFCCCEREISTAANVSNYKEQSTTFNGTYSWRYGNKPFPSIVRTTLLNSETRLKKKNLTDLYKMFLSAASSSFLPSHICSKIIWRSPVTDYMPFLANIQSRGQHRDNRVQLVPRQNVQLHTHTSTYKIYFPLNMKQKCIFLCCKN